MRGDLISIDWVDIYENSVADPNTATLARRTSYGLFWEQKEDKGVPVIVTTTTIDDDSSQSGFCIYPLGCIVAIKIEKRKRRKRGSINSSTT
jgi:tRNA(Ile)-lysidine synthase TilS/MesJ